MLKLFEASTKQNKTTKHDCFFIARGIYGLEDNLGDFFSGDKTQIGISIFCNYQIVISAVFVALGCEKNAVK